MTADSVLAPTASWTLKHGGLPLAKVAEVVEDSGLANRWLALLHSCKDLIDVNV